MPGVPRLEPLTLTSEGIVHIVADRHAFMDAWARHRANLADKTFPEVMTLCGQKKRIAELVRGRVTCLLCLGAYNTGTVPDNPYGI